ncbi:MAG TPA: hypothetical protein VFF68_00990 [Anaerolineaceae bacterium]|nr:hypothetical protein [Anaerolineaceae bacterium]
MQIDTPEIRAKVQSPYIVEFTRNLDDAANVQLLKDLFARERLELTFVGPGQGGSCTGYFGLQIELPVDLKTALSQELDRLLAYHRALSGRSYEAALDQYNRENPLEVSPVLPPARPAAQPPARLAVQSALANALFIGVMAVIAVVVYHLLTREGAIFAERLVETIWFPGPEIWVISLLVAGGWSWMFRIWPFLANYAACFLCLWGFQCLVAGLGVNPIAAAVVCCAGVTTLFAVASYLWTAVRQGSAPQKAPPPAPPVPVEPVSAAPADPLPAGEAAGPPEAPSGELSTAAAAEPLPLVPAPASAPAPTAPPPGDRPVRASAGCRQVFLIVLAVLLVLGVVAVLQAVLGSLILPPAAGGDLPGPVPSGCRLWSEIGSADAGQTVCVYGVVQTTYLGGSYTYLRFDEDPNAFRLVNVAGNDYSEVTGQCVLAEGIVEVYGQMPYIEITDRLEICRQ